MNLREVRLIAPEHIRYEVPAVITTSTLEKSPRLTEEEGLRAVRNFLGLSIDTFTGEERAVHAYRVARAIGCSFYDALYVGLAEEFQIPFITADAKLLRQIHSQHELIWLGDYPLTGG